MRTTPDTRRFTIRRQTRSSGSTRAISRSARRWSRRPPTRSRKRPHRVAPRLDRRSVEQLRKKGRLTGMRAIATVRLTRATIRASPAYRAVRDGELLRSRGLFVAEGRQIVRRVVEDAPVSRAVRAPQRRGAARSRAGDCGAAAPDVPILVCAARSRSADIAGYDVHRGCLALVHRPPDTAVGRVARRRVDAAGGARRRVRMPTTSAGSSAMPRRLARTACC